MTDWPKQSEVDSFYGNPRGQNGGPSILWEKRNLVTIPCPWKLFTAWDTRMEVKRIRIHGKCADSLTRVLAQAWEQSGKKQEAIEAQGLHLFGGSYNFRLMRGSTRLSMHSWGCAVDFDPANNGLGDYTPKIQPGSLIVKCFKAEGWTWGGDWNGNLKVADERRPDAMHFQAADV